MDELLFGIIAIAATAAFVLGILQAWWAVLLAIVILGIALGVVLSR